MSATLITYLWHYLAARAIYDELLRPLTRGDPAPLLVLAILVALAVLVGRLTRMRNRP